MSCSAYHACSSSAQRLQPGAGISGRQHTRPFLPSRHCTKQRPLEHPVASLPDLLRSTRRSIDEATFAWRSQLEPWAEPSVPPAFKERMEIKRQVDQLWNQHHQLTTELEQVQADRIAVEHTLATDKDLLQLAEQLDRLAVSVTTLSKDLEAEKRRAEMECKILQQKAKREKRKEAVQAGYQPAAEANWVAPSLTLILFMASMMLAWVALTGIQQGKYKAVMASSLTAFLSEIPPL